MAPSGRWDLGVVSCSWPNTSTRLSSTRSRSRPRSTSPTRIPAASPNRSPQEPLAAPTLDPDRGVTCQPAVSNGEPEALGQHVERLPDPRRAEPPAQVGHPRPGGTETETSSRTSGPRRKVAIDAGTRFAGDHATQLPAADSMQEASETAVRLAAALKLPMRRSSLPAYVRPSPPRRRAAAVTVAAWPGP